jgi:hypothetical protein
MSGAPNTRDVSIRACVVMAVITLAAAGGLYLGAIDGVGFPDGHLTDYERWALRFQKPAVVGLSVLGAGFPFLAAVKSPVAGRLFRASVVAVLILLVTALVLVPRVGLNLLRLEHGQGGWAAAIDHSAEPPLAVTGAISPSIGGAIG